MLTNGMKQLKLGYIEMLLKNKRLKEGDLTESY